jgi:signal transduction histidine kinase
VTEPDLHHGHVEEVVRDLDVTIRDIRSTIFDLERGREASLRAGVAALVREYEPALGFLPGVRTWGPLNSLVSCGLAEQAMAVLREALSNCARHAAADHCAVEVSVEDGWLVLDVVDDGRGPCGAEEGSGAHRSGLRNLRRRAEELGGELVVERQVPHGTRVTWRVPVDHD